MDEYELLLRQASAWAEKRKRPFDRELVRQAVSLRADHDGLAANDWPPGSVEHLMVERWATHGPTGVPDVEALVASLESFWRFLRNTGRMARACDPATLVAEARAAAPAMEQACADPGNFGQAKMLLDFGREIGIDLDEVAGIDELNARMAEIVAAFNALPEQERRARTDPAIAKSRDSRLATSLTDAAAHMAQSSQSLDDWSLPPTPRLDGVGSQTNGGRVGVFGQPVEADGQPVGPDDGPDGMLSMLDPSTIAAEARRTPFMRQLLALVEWVGEGRQVTSTGLLRPAVAREAFDELHLLGFYEQLGIPLDDAAVTQLRDGWRSAGDCLALARLWEPALATDLISVSSTRARGLPGAGDGDDQVVALLALAAIFTALDVMDDMLREGVVHTLLSIFPDLTEGRVRVDDLQHSWHTYLNATTGRQWAWDRDLSDLLLERSWGAMDDCGLWRRQKGWVSSTNLGRDVTLLVVRALDEAELNEEW